MNVSRYNACANLDKLWEKIERLKEEMAWAFVCEKEKVVEGLAKELKVEEVRTPKFVQKVEESQRKLDAKEHEQIRVQVCYGWFSGLFCVFTARCCTVVQSVLLQLHLRDNLLKT